jgi:hypothetical protein
MRVLCHASALIGIKEYVINVERSGNKRFGISAWDLKVSRTGRCVNFTYGEKALIERTEFDVNLDLVVLEGNKGKSKSWVTAEPELKRNVKRGLGKSLARSTDGLRDVVSTTSSGNLSELRVS